MKQNKRNLQTENAIIDALITLINKKGFGNLNVTDLTREAHIGRGTFYIHYLDKHDLLNRVEDYILNQFQDNLKTVMPEAMKDYYDKHNINRSPSKIVIHLLDDFYEHRQLLAALLGEKGDPLFVNKIKKMFSQVIYQTFENFDGVVEFNDRIPKDYVREIMMDMLMDTVIYWIKKSDPEKPEEIAQIITNLQEIAPYNYIQLKSK